MCSLLPHFTILFNPLLSAVVDNASSCALVSKDYRVLMDRKEMSDLTGRPGPREKRAPEANVVKG